VSWVLKQSYDLQGVGRQGHVPKIQARDDISARLDYRFTKDDEDLIDKTGDNQGHPVHAREYNDSCYSDRRRRGGAVLKIEDS